MTTRWPHSEEIIALGMIFLAGSLAYRHLGSADWLVSITAWVGSIMVIVGTGKLFFLDD